MREEGEKRRLREQETESVRGREGVGENEWESRRMGQNVEKE